MKWQDRIRKKAIYAIKQLPEYEKGDPRSVFSPYYELGKRQTYYRRGDGRAYRGNFIPIWFCPILFDKVIMYLPPCSKEEDLFNYCGANLTQVLELIKADLLVPLVNNDLDSYQETVFGGFVRKLPADKPLIRAHLFEDGLLGGDLEFQNRVAQRTERYEEIVGETDAPLKSEYETARKENPLIKPLYELPWFIAERVEWQELLGLNKNAEIMERTLRDQSPLIAYRTARTLHYIVIPKIYSRGGFTMLAYNDDVHFTDQTGKALASAVPQGTDKVSTIEARLRVPIAKEEVEPAIELVKWIRKHDKGKKKEEEKITGDINKVMEDLWDTCSFQESPVKRYTEDTEALNKAFDSFCERVRQALPRKIARQEREQFLSGGLTSLPALFRHGDPRRLAKGLMESAEQITDLVTSPVKKILSMLIKAELISENDPDIVIKTQNLLRDLESSIQLWGEKEEMKTPFMLIGYDRNRK